MDTKIGFVGAGNIGSAMISSIIRSGFAPASSIFATRTDIRKLEQLKSEMGINVCRSNVELVNAVDVIIMAVKPQIINKVIEEIKNCFGDKLLVTIAAGIPIKKFEDVLGENKRILRAMPNLPLLVGQGMTIIACKTGTERKDIEFVKALFENFGRVEEMDESLLGAVISLTASSPAYVFMMIESMVASAVRVGVPVKQAMRIVAQSILGSAKLMVDGKWRLNQSVNVICIENGFEGIDFGELDKKKMKSMIEEAMEACNKRAFEFEKMNNM